MTDLPAEPYDDRIEKITEAQVDQIMAGIPIVVNLRQLANEMRIMPAEVPMIVTHIPGSRSLWTYQSLRRMSEAEVLAVWRAAVETTSHTPVIRDEETP